MDYESNENNNVSAEPSAPPAAPPEKGSRAKSFWRRIAAGVIIGFGCILPGVSGGVLAIAFGLYSPMLDAIAHLLKRFKESFLFLLPLGIGGVVGVLAGAMLLDWLLATYYVLLMYLFIGFVAGGIPGFIKDANEKGFKWYYLIGTVVGAGIVVGFVLLEDALGVSTGSISALSPFQALISGVLIALGTVIPGISTSFILIYLGWYQAVLDCIATFNIINILCLAAGALITGLLLIKLVRWLFRRFHGAAYWTVLGFLAASIVVIFPGFWWKPDQLVYILFFIVGSSASFLLEHAIHKSDGLAVSSEK